MIREHLIGLRERRLRLLTRAAAERAAAAAALARLDGALAWIGTLQRALDEARRHPLMLAAAAALLLALRPRGLSRMLAGGWSLWRLYRRLRPWLAPILETPARSARPGL